MTNFDKNQVLEQQKSPQNSWFSEKDKSGTILSRCIIIEMEKAFSLLALEHQNLTGKAEKMITHSHR